MGFQPGEEVLPKEQPFSHIINNKFRSTFCDWCIQEKESDKKLTKCHKCNEVFYCNRACQRKAYVTYHKSECGKLKTITSDISPEMKDVLIFMGRTIKKVQNGGDKLIAKLPDGTERCFDDLMSHEEEILQIHSETIAPFRTGTPWCQTFFGDASFEYLLRIFGKININKHGIISSKMAHIGDALYIGASAIDHACSPNAIFVTKNGKEISIRALEKVENFSEVRISYIKPSDNTENRRNKLKLHYHFDCECRLCEDEEKDNCRSSMLCPKAKIGDLDYYEHCVPMKTAQCIKCGSRISKKIIEKYKHYINQEDHSFEEWICGEPSKIVHPCDSFFFRFAQKCTEKVSFLMPINALPDYLQDEEHFRKLNIALATNIEKYVGDYNPLRGHIYFQCAANLSVSKQEETLQLCSIFLNGAMEVMEVTHGIDHPQYKLMEQKFNELGDPELDSDYETVSESDPDANSDPDVDSDPDADSDPD